MRWLAGRRRGVDAMNTGTVHGFVDSLAKLLELAGVAIIIIVVLLAAIGFVRAGLRDGEWQAAYATCRSKNAGIRRAFTFLSTSSVGHIKCP